MMIYTIVMFNKKLKEDLEALSSDVRIVQGRCDIGYTTQEQLAERIKTCEIEIKKLSDRIESVVTGLKKVADRIIANETKPNEILAVGVSVSKRLEESNTTFGTMVTALQDRQTALEKRLADLEKPVGPKSKRPTSKPKPKSKSK